jgi:tetratricopeptide (TPR) repeat protein
VNDWSLSAAEQVCAAAGALDLDVLEGLAGLLDKSLLLQEVGSDGEVRYRLLYVLREFGLERLEEAGELATTREAHAAYYLALAEETEPQMRSTAPQAWQERFEREHDNLRAALTWWLELAEQASESKAAERALRLCGVLSDFWFHQFYWSEGLAFLKRALALRAGVAAAVQVKLNLGAAGIMVNLGELELGEKLLQEALARARQDGDMHSTAHALLDLGAVAMGRDQLAVARAFYEEAAALLQQSEHALDRYSYFLHLCQVLLYQGEYERARGLLEESLAYYRALGTQPEVGQALMHLGNNLFFSLHDPARGIALVEQSLTTLREAGDTWGAAIALLFLSVMRRYQRRFVEAHRLLEEGQANTQWGPHDVFQLQAERARLLWQQGKLVEAQALYQETWALLPKRVQRVYIAEYLEGLAALQSAQGRPQVAARLWGAAEALREAVGSPMFPVDRAEYAPAIAAARTTLGEAAFAAAWAEGRQLTPQQALATAD